MDHPGQSCEDPSDSEEDEPYEMKRSTLLKQLKGILDNYPDNAQIIKELIQNAEDAGASEIRIFHDQRQIESSDNNEYINYFKPPALCVYNNAKFTKEDWEGITTIYDSNKQEKPLKIGHYGLGFKSVFHITDTPVIVSGKQLLIIDPCKGTQECIPKSLRNIPKDTNLKNAIQFILKKFGFTQDCFMNGSYDGTLFWFPLRQHESKLSSNVYNCNKLQSLLNAFQEEVPLCLLFLRNVKKICIHNETADFENPSFSVVHKINTNYYEVTHFQETIHSLRNNIPAENKICGFQSTMSTLQAGKSNEIEKWVVFNLVKGTKYMSEEFIGLSKTLKYYPFVGIASKISLEKEPLLGHVFCFLPLPLQQESLTGLPVHVNGFFALGQNRGYVKWPTSEHEDYNNKEIQWNQRLCKEALVEAYLEIISMLKDITMEASLTSPEDNLAYKALPDISIVHSNWSDILDPLYNAVFDTNAFYTQNCGGKWIEKSASIFSIFEWNPLDPTNRHEIEEVVLKVLSLCNENTVLIPRHLKDALLHYRPKCQKLSPEFVLKKLKSAENYKELSKTEKIQLLEFLLSSEEMDFNGLELLPLNDGSFVSFNSTASTIYVCFERNDQLMFPLLESKFANFELHHNSRTKIRELATKGLFQLKVFEPSLFPMLLAETLKLNGCMVVGVDKPFNIQVSRTLSDDWLQLVWSYLNKYFEKLLEFEELHILPQQSDSGLNLLRLKGMYMLKSYPGIKPLPEFVDEALTALTVTVIDNLPKQLDHLDLREHYCKLPSADNVPHLLQELHCSSSCLQDIIKHFNEACSYKAKRAFVTYLAEELTSELSIISKEILEKLNIFEESNNKNGDKSLVSVAENKYIACKESFPFPFPKPYLVLDDKAALLAKQLGGVQLSWKEMVKQSLLFISRGNENKHYTDKAVQTLMEYFMLNISFFTNDSETLELVKNTNFVTTLSGNKLKPVDVLNPDDESLKKLFAVYPDNFPDERFREKIMLNGLKHLGLRGISNISQSDLINLAEKIQNSDTRKRYESAFKLLETLQANPTLIQDSLISLCWVPCVTERPSHYPEAMPWYGETVSNGLCSPKEVCSLDFMNIGGTETCFVDVDKATQIAKSFKWNEPPSTEIVIAHLAAVIDVYKKVEKIDLLGILQGIYEHFNKTDVSELKGKLKNVPSVFNNQGFCFPANIIIGSFDDVDVLDMRPYIYRLPEEFHKFRNMFIALGCAEKVELTHLINILQEVSQAHQDSEVQKPPSDLIRDRKLVISVLQKLIDIKPEEYDTSNILVPINTETRLEMKPVKDCTYCTELLQEPNINKDKPELTKVELYVHPDVPSSLAKSLNIQSLTKRFMNENNVSEITVQNWGQFEPLTTRIANLLESYTDGFSVLKELIQNAEDAGATVVRFMYDERTNDHLKTNVIGNMRECQGPAFWVFNDAEFQKEDFENIIKLGGRTKQTDRHKIGKFGLGFNSVYNLTDVPSFISGNTMVILDPHTSYLEEAISQKNNPGIRIDFTNPEFLRIYKDQFEVYNNVFDCMLSQENFPPNYQGTLFRFPLRTEAQAVTSDIKKLHYNKKEMISLLQKLESSIGDLLMFTQNIETIELWHLGEKSVDPFSANLIFKAYKQILHTVPSEAQGKSVVRQAVDILENMCTNQTKPVNFRIIQRIRIDFVMNPNDLMPSSKVDVIETEANWLISWSTGKNDAVRKSIELKDRGALCIGAVSLSMHIKNDVMFPEIFPIQHNMLGFYNQSHIFCFMPLPEICDMPVHINGCFAVEDDRKRICQATEDEKSSVDADWNSTMFRDAVCDAYIHMLLFLNRESKAVNVFNVWPKQTNSVMMEKMITRELIQSFYSTIIIDNPCIFNNNGIAACFSDCLFLESRIRHNKTVGKIAFDCLMKYHEGPEIVMDISEDIILQFQLAGQDKILRRRTLTVFDFFQKIVFPNIVKMKNHAQERDALVLYAINGDICIRNLVQETYCIPTLPNGVLKKPSDLVNPKSKIANLFIEEDERFPIGTKETFNSEQVLDTLVMLGMMEDTLPEEIILECARSIRTLKEDVEIKERCKHLLQYIETALVSNTLLKDISCVPFLPILKKSPSWPLKWNGDTENKDCVSVGSLILGKPKHLFMVEAENLIGSIHSVVNTSDLWLPNITRILIKLGVRDRSKVELEDAVKQLKSLRSIVTEHLDIEQSKTMYTITQDLYKYLERETLIEGIQLKHLQDYPVIWMKEELLCPRKVACSDDDFQFNCEPEIYFLDKTLKQYKHFFEKIGMLQLQKGNILEIILRIQKENKERKLSLVMVNMISNLLLLLWNIIVSQREMLTKAEMDSILVPDKCARLRPSGDLCFDDDYPLLTDEDSVHFVNEHVPPVVHKMLGIKSKRCQHLLLITDSMPFGQKEDLVTRIHGILKNSSYHSVLNEMLQNSDDAGASEVHFILDKRQHTSENVFSDSWVKLQGPALCIFNNSCFSEDDLRGIVNLGIGSKSQNPSKTGQFGIGFNAVYHITDVPSFLTKGKATPDGGTFCVFDPHCQYCPVAKEDNPGMRIRNLKSFKQNYPGVYNCYLQDIIQRSQGTWFRLPLRTPDMANKSSVENKPTSIEDIEFLFQEFKMVMLKSLLFLRFVKKINISILSESGNLTQVYEVKADVITNSNKDLHSFFENCDKLSLKLKERKLALHEVPSFDIDYKVSLSDSEDKHENWIVVQKFGSSSEMKIPSEVCDMIIKGEIGLSPKGGVALKVEDKTSTSTFVDNEETKGLAYYCLPLPIKTGLPLHVNGNFALDPARQSLREDLGYGLWNKYLVESVLPDAYVKAIIKLKENLFLGNTEFDDEHLNTNFYLYYAVFPLITRARNPTWKNLTSIVLYIMFQKELEIFPIVLKSSIKWVALKTTGHQFPVFFDNNPLKPTMLEFEEKRQNLQIYFEKGITTERADKHCEDEETASNDKMILSCILKDIGIKLIYAPDEIFKNIVRALHNCESTLCSTCKASIFVENVRRITTKDVLEFLEHSALKTYSPDGCLVTNTGSVVEETVMKNTCRVRALLQYCMNEKELLSSKLQHLPLLVTNDGILHRFSDKNPVYLSEFYELLPNSKANFVHEDLVTVLQPIQDECKEILNVLGLPAFVELLPFSLSTKKMLHEERIVWNEDIELPSRKWMEMFWRYLDFLNIEDPNEIIHCFDKWCLVPGTDCNATQDILVPFNRRFMVLDITSFPHRILHIWREQNTYFSVFSSLSLPKPITLCQKSKTIKSVVASHKRPGSVLECLVAYKCKLETAEQNVKEDILMYLNENIDFTEEMITPLRSLPLFQTITSRYVSLDKDATILILQNGYCLPKDGIPEWAEQSDLVVLRDKNNLRKLLLFVGGKVITVTDFYSDYVLNQKYFRNLESKFHGVHLNFIRKTLPFSKCCFVERLRQLKFIPREKYLESASFYYSPHIHLFKTMSEYLHFPPPPYDETIWMEFMLSAGMKDGITVPLCVKFAEKINKGLQNGLSCKLKLQSEELVKYLFQGEIDLFLMERIKQIPFIIPHEVLPSHNSISLQFKRQVPICFMGSVPIAFENLVWTTMSILPSYADPEKALPNQTDKVRNLQRKLGIEMIPPIEKVISHIKRVCLSLKQRFDKSDLFPRLDKRDISILMASFYSHLLKHGRCEKDRTEMSEIPLVCIENEETGVFSFVKPYQIVQHLLPNDEIQPYLVRIPYRYGEYCELFIFYGATEYPTLQQYSETLKSIFEESKSNYLIPTEINMAAKALTGFLEILQKKKREEIEEDMKAVSVLYLMDDDKCQRKLLASNHLILVDNQQFRRRLKDEKLHFMANINENAVEVVQKLPRRLQPHVLSKTVNEILLSSTDDRVTGHAVTELLQTFLESKDFLKGVGVFSRKKTKKSRIADVKSNPVDMIKIVNVRCLESVVTVLKYNGDIINTSKRNVDCFCMYDYPGNCTIYIQKKDWSTREFLKVVKNPISELLYKVTNYQVEKEQIKDMLDFIDDLKGLERYINNLVDEEDENDESECLPKIGSFVPKVFHALLDNKFYELSVGEYVAYEVWDPLIETDTEYKDAAYIYVKVLYKVVNTSTEGVIQDKYLVDIGSENDELVDAIKLYKIQRRPDTEVDVKTIVYSEIRLALMYAWDKNEKVKKRIIKRLLLQWHPDKNIGNETFCKEVTQYILYVVRRLEKEETVDDDIGRQGSSSYAHFAGEWSGFAANMFTQSTNSRYYNQSWSEERINKYVNPQPDEAKRWMRQADLDLRAAKITLQSEDAKVYNWVCAQCHQACEKALKAVVMKVDMNSVNRHSHRLTNIIIGMSVELDGSVRRAISDLERLVGSYTRMRYPDTMQYPYIPGDVYTEEHASDALKLASHIVSNLADKL